MKQETPLIKYIFLDVVKFTKDRTIEAQTDIINQLNKIVLESVNELKSDHDDIQYLPTGDGICICLIEVLLPLDIHLKFSLKILEKLYSYNESQNDEKRKFRIRIGINENQDNIIKDINNNRNFAGAGINHSQRIMSIAENNQIIVSQSIYDKLSQREIYNNSFKPRNSILEKNKEKILAYQYVNDDIIYLNSSTVVDQDLTPKPIPKTVALYYLLLLYFHNEIKELTGLGEEDSILQIIISYIIDDYISYEKLTSIELAKWTPRLFNNDINDFKKAFELLSKSNIFLIFNTSSYLLEKNEITKWYHLFKSDYLEVNSVHQEKITEQWPELKDKLNDTIIKMYEHYKWFV